MKLNDGDLAKTLFNEDKMQNYSKKILKRHKPSIGVTLASGVTLADFRNFAL